MRTHVANDSERKRPSVLLVHERYRHRGGEDVVVEQEARLLQDAGHRVDLLFADNHEIPEQLDLRARVGLALTTVWSRRGARRVADAVGRYSPDVVHIHNTFPLLSPAIYTAARVGGAAVVQTLHNYRLICPSADLFRDGRPCQDCVGRLIPWPGVVHSCYRDSIAQSGVVATMLTAHRARRTWHREVDLFVAPSPFARSRLVAGGLDSSQIAVKPNFVHPDPSVGDDPTDRGAHFLFVGRLSREKGLETLIEAWAGLGDAGVCRVAGDGPLADLVQAADGRGIVALGRLEPGEVARELRTALALVFPSDCYEVAPLTILEAFACGLPVIASGHGGMADVVEDGQTGILFAPGDSGDLRRAVRWARDHPSELAVMGANARRVFEQRYSAAAAYSALAAVYARAIRRAGARQRRSASVS